MVEANGQLITSENLRLVLTGNDQPGLLPPLPSIPFVLSCFLSLVVLLRLLHLALVCPHKYTKLTLGLLVYAHAFVG